MVLGQVQQIVQWRIGYENKPGQSGISIEQDLGRRKPPQVMAVREQLRVNLISFHGALR